MIKSSGKWMELKNTKVSEIARPRKKNVTCSLSYVDLGEDKEEHL